MIAHVAQTLADTAGLQHMTGWGWGWMVLGWLTVVGLVVWTVNNLSRGSSSRRTDAEEVLAERFARGELTVEEYEEGRSALRS